MAQYVSPAQLSGFYKEVYGDDVVKLIPEQNKLLRMLPFIEREKELGNKYHQPVLLSRSHGFTYASANSGAFALNNHVAPQTQDATLQGSQILLREAIGYDTAARATTSKKAFQKATDFLVEEMADSMSYRVELSLLYGGVGLTKCNISANVNSTTTKITATLAHWAEGMWAGSENCPVDIYQNDQATKINANAALTISSVDFDNRFITVTGNSSDISALDTYIAANADKATIYFYGANGNEMSGLDAIITNTGTLFGIDAGTYKLWKGNSVDCSNGTFTMAKLLGGLAKAVSRGLMQDVVVMVHPQTWANLQSDLAALRRYDGSYSSEKSTNGSKEILFYGQSGEIKIVSHPYIKQGSAYAFPPKRLKRLGATDVTFNTPGRGDEIFLQMPNNAGFELRVYADMALFIEKPAHCVKFINIVNS